MIQMENSITVDDSVLTSELEKAIHNLFHAQSVSESNLFIYHYTGDDDNNDDNDSYNDDDDDDDNNDDGDNYS